MPALKLKDMQIWRSEWVKRLLETKTVLNSVRHGALNMEQYVFCCVYTFNIHVNVHSFNLWKHACELWANLLGLEMRIYIILFPFFKQLFLNLARNLLDHASYVESFLEWLWWVLASSIISVTVKLISLFLLFPWWTLETSPTCGFTCVSVVNLCLVMWRVVVHDDLCCDMLKVLVIVYYSWSWILNFDIGMIRHSCIPTLAHILWASDHQNQSRN